MSDDRIHDAISRGARARALLEDDLLTEAFGTLVETYMEAWRVSRVEHKEDRERLWLAVNLVGKLRDQLINVLNNGKIAQAELDQITGREKARAKR